MRTRLIVLTLAVWMAASLVGSASAYRGGVWNPVTSTSHVRSLREGVAWQRAQTWRWQDVAGVARTRSAFAERRTAKESYLRWLVELWNGRRDSAYRYAKAHPSPRSTVDSCTAWIVDREDPGWDPGRWNSQGSGAFGLPQAKPYSKMPKAAWPRSAGGQENPYVQLQWMVRYETERYGSPCAAKAYWLDHSSY